MRPRKVDGRCYPCRRTSELQWGRGGEAAESRSPEADRIADVRGFNGAAAVRPRKEARTSTHDGVDASELQWGRGGEAAERLAARSRAEPRSVSFNGAAAVRPRKDGRCGPVCAVMLGFNGAAAVRPRKGDSSCRRAASDRALQWGRGGEAAERRSIAHVRLPVIDASMGPRR